MASYNSSIDSATFWFNFLSVRNSWQNDIPLDILIFNCKQCNDRLVMNPNGVILLDESLEEPVNEFMNTWQTFLVENHISCSETCTGDQIEISEAFGPPVNIVILLPPTDHRYLTSFTIEDCKYEIQMTVQSKEDINKSILVVYKHTGSKDLLYSDFIKDNFHFNLNIDLDVDEDSYIGVEDAMIDEETSNEFRHMIPRLSGGGRKLNQHYTYFCQWCPKDEIKNSQKGKFLQIKNYRDHFRRVHSDIDYNEFLRCVTKRDPKWCCPNCRRLMSISHSVRHKAICNVSEDEDDDEEEEEDNGDEDEDKDKDDDDDDDDDDNCDGDGNGEEEAPNNEEEMDQTENIANPSTSNRTSQTKNKPARNKKSSSDKLESSSDEDKDEEEEIVADGDNVSKASGVYNFQSDDETMEEIPKYASNRKSSKISGQSKSSKIALIDPTSIIEKTPKLTTIFKKISEGKYRVIETNRNNNVEVTIGKPEFSIRDEFNATTSETDTESEPENEDAPKETSQTKWWTNSLKEYTDRGYHGMDIFLKTDSEEFVQRVIQNWKTHQANKIILDKRNEEVENSDLSLNQFSVTRDQPVLESYSKFIQSCSTKDVLNLYSADYDENSVQVGAKASTAKSYERRIMELFTFLAKRYDKFHLDWCTDYCGSIEKVTSTGQRTFDIFVLSKEDLIEFIGQYKYGNNPAANVNLRIFAAKKFLEFLIKNYKDNEDKFPGTIVEKSRIVECLDKKLSDVNQGLAPNGTIKALSIASNKNHKQILLDQMKQCPEKSLKKIMDGVASYLKSSEYSSMKAMLYELAYKKTKQISRKEYVLLTNWLLEMLICLGGNRPCALLGITIGIKVNFLMFPLFY